MLNGVDLRKTVFDQPSSIGGQAPGVGSVAIQEGLGRLRKVRNELAKVTRQGANDPAVKKLDKLLAHAANGGVRDEERDRLAYIRATGDLKDIGF